MYLGMNILESSNEDDQEEPQPQDIAYQGHQEEDQQTMTDTTWHTGHVKNQRETKTPAPSSPTRWSGPIILYRCFSIRNRISFLINDQGPVVQSVVSLTSSLRVISLTVLADSIYNIMIIFAEKMWVAFALQKLLTFFQQKISAYLRITQCKF